MHDTYRKLKTEVSVFGGYWNQYYSDVTKASWCPESLAIQLVVEQLIQASNKVNSITLYYYLFAIGIHQPPQRASNTESVPMSQFHNEYDQTINWGLKLDVVSLILH